MMPEFRVFFLDEAGHITSKVEFVADDDTAAIQQVIEQYPHEKIELWSGAVLLATPATKSERSA